MTAPGRRADATKGREHGTTTHCARSRCAGSGERHGSLGRRARAGYELGDREGLLPDPVAQPHNEGLTDLKDADYAALQPRARR